MFLLRNSFWNNMSKIYGISIILFLASSASVKITNMRVPAVYMIERKGDTGSIVLDCEYEVNPVEKGFVLKWLHNNNQIYQWIPSGKGFAKGFAMGHMKTKIEAIHSTNKNHNQISIIKPEWNMTGEYACFVQTFESTDRKVGHMQIVVAESDFHLSAKVSHDPDGNGIIDIICLVQEVFPEPTLTVILNNEILRRTVPDLKRNKNGLYNLKVKVKLYRKMLESPTPITCILSLAETNYTKRRETLFYDEAKTTFTPSSGEEISSAVSRFEADKNFGSETLSKILWIKLIVLVITEYILAYS
ncbi:uncharacterized protein LOC129607534 [Condylostylus longicornis]|uniref:uncharacterized protein LOC129607534 n=1 Tax=Condylostylus longicornis TaxID=2530218 RepID=UPI00244DCFFD|nr:uncharacterized protein LOC129607534 [Condylostylus longicornis]